MILLSSMSALDSLLSNELCNAQASSIGALFVSMRKLRNVHIHLLMSNSLFLVIKIVKSCPNGINFRLFYSLPGLNEVTVWLA